MRRASPLVKWLTASVLAERWEGRGAAEQAEADRAEGLGGRRHDVQGMVERPLAGSCERDHHPESGTLRADARLVAQTVKIVRWA